MGIPDVDENWLAYMAESNPLAQTLLDGLKAQFQKIQKPQEPLPWDGMEDEHG